jgi:FtsX-like permease family
MKELKPSTFRLDERSAWRSLQMWLETLRQDLRYGARTLRRNPAFTAVSILALALGIAVNTVVFTMYKALVARPIDARDPDTLVNITLRLQSGKTAALFSYPDFEAYRDGLRTFSGVIAFSIEQLTLSAAIASSISLFGLLLASMGIYSAVSYDVALRTREVGIRMAIGAQKRDILGVMMRGRVHAVLVGLAAGVLLALGAARLLRGVLYGLGALDVVSFAAASVLFLTIALAASWVPSRRAMHIDPLAALRDL